MILVTGATGNLGKTTIDFLLKKGIKPHNIAALARNEGKSTDLKNQGVDIRIGNYDDYDSILKALEGVEKLLLISGSDVGKRTHQHENVVKAAKEKGVKHILYTSFERKNGPGSSPLGLLAESHILTEKAIKESGINYTLFRNNMYLDFVPMILGEKVFENGVFYPAGEGKAAFALRSEMAEAAAIVLKDTGHENKEYYFSNSEEVSFQDIADIISELSGKKITYTSPDTNTYIETLVNAGVPKEFASVFAGFAEAIKQGELCPENRDLETLLGRKPTTVKEFLKGIYNS